MIAQYILIVIYALVILGLFVNINLGELFGLNIIPN